MVGRWDDAVKDGKRALSFAQDSIDNSLICLAAWGTCLAYTMKGELEKAIKYGEPALDQASTPGDKVMASAGRLREDIRRLDDIFQMTGVAGLRQYVVLAGRALLEAYYVAGGYDHARRTAEEYLQVAEQNETRRFSASAHRYL